MPDLKFARLEDDQWVAHDYGNRYFLQPCGQATRLVVGPSSGHVELVLELSRQLAGQPWAVLYVLLVPRTGDRKPGRYQSPPFESHAALTDFLSSFAEFFEGDGRHHVWVGSS